MTNNLIPKHIAIVMDGNGRWAKRQGVDRIEGHRLGAQVALDIVRHAAERGIKYLTLYTFSSENWRRPAEEVDSLMELLSFYLRKEINALHKNGVKLNFIGDRSKLSNDIVQKLLAKTDQ